MGKYSLLVNLDGPDGPGEVTVGFESEPGSVTRAAARAVATVVKGSDVYDEATGCVVTTEADKFVYRWSGSWKAGGKDAKTQA